jgi:hypothetical protein
MAHMLNKKNDVDDFDKLFGRIFKFGIAYIVVSALVGLGALGVLGWAVISLVLHFT